MKKLFIATILTAACGSQRLKIDPVTVRPIHLTIDLNVHDQDKPAAKDGNVDAATAPKR